MTLRLSLDILTGEYALETERLGTVIAGNATRAMDEAGVSVKQNARSDIARAGFGIRWQNTLRVDRYPKRPRTSMNPSLYVWHKIPYAGVFEDGATIIGRPYLWIPLEGTPTKVNRKRMTPGEYISQVGPLIPMTSAKGQKLLGASVRVARTQAVSARPKVTLRSLRRGADARKTGVLRTIPLFVGIKQTVINKKMNIRQICAVARDSIPALYARNFKDTP